MSKPRNVPSALKYDRSHLTSSRAYGDTFLRRPCNLISWLGASLSDITRIVTQSTVTLDETVACSNFGGASISTTSISGGGLAPRAQPLQRSRADVRTAP